LAGVVIGSTHRNRRARKTGGRGGRPAQNLRRLLGRAHDLRGPMGFHGRSDGTGRAARPTMAAKRDPLEIPMLVILWSTLVVGFVMVLVVLLMRQ
jgi:hypothetical protein